MLSVMCVAAVLCSSMADAIDVDASETALIVFAIESNLGHCFASSSLNCRDLA